MNRDRLWVLGKLLEADDSVIGTTEAKPDPGRKSMTLIQRLVVQVEKELFSRIKNDAEQIVIDHVEDILKKKKKELKAAGDPTGQMVEDMVLTRMLSQGIVQAFKRGLADYHGLSDAIGDNQ
jgi:hypothetical protein